MPVYKKGSKWRVRVWHQGQRQDWIVEGTKKEALEFEATKRVERKSTDPRHAQKNVPSFSNFSTETYKPHAQLHLKLSTYRNRTYTLATLIEFFGSTPLDAITVVSIEEYKNRRNAAGIRPSTINDELKVLRTILGYAQEIGCAVVPPKIKNVPVRGERKVTFWTTAEAERLIKEAGKESPVLEALTVFILNTGCRKGEAIALRWEDVDRKRGLVLIQPNEEWQPKNNRPREIPISSALMPYLKNRGSDKWVFPSSDGERFAYWPQRYFDRARDAARLTGGPHTARHTFASHFLAGCPDLFLLGRLLGHGNTYVTELYSHLLPDHLRRAKDVVSFGRRTRTVPKKRKPVPRKLHSTNRNY
jgi:integrase